MLRSAGMPAKKRHDRLIPFRRTAPSTASQPKPTKPAEPPEQESLALPARPAPLGSDELDLFPHQLRTGDRYTDDSGDVWVVAGSPTGLRHGKGMAVRFKGADDPGAEWRQVWPAHERVRSSERREEV